MRKTTIKSIDNEVLNILMSHNFPGNIRELENIIEYAFVLCSDENIQLKHVPGNISSNSIFTSKYKNLNEKSLKSAETLIILNALKRNNYNRKATANYLGIHKSTLFRKINQLSLKLPKIDGRSRRK